MSSSKEENKKRSIDEVESSQASAVEKKPFDHLKIDSNQILCDVESRSTCPTCQKSAKYFCYKCHKVIGMDRSNIPCVDLPVPLDIIKHSKELDGKSTAIHAKVIAEKDVHIYSYPNDIPDYKHPERTLLLFPSRTAKPITDIDRSTFDRVAVIDGTWSQAKQIIHHTPLLQKMQHVTIQPRKTTFWRFQNVDDQHLATIEAIYYLYREFAEAFEQPYAGQYDNLLYYYTFFYNLVQETYKHKDKKGSTFTARHQQRDYIKYEKNSSGSGNNEKKSDEENAVQVKKA